MTELNKQAKLISMLLPKIARNLRIAPLIDAVKPGLTTSQLMVLLILKDIKNTEIPIGNLTQKLAISFPSVSGIIDRLYKDKLVDRTRSKLDRRLVLIKLTDEGREVINKLIKSFEELLLAILKEMPLAEQKSITKSIERVFRFSTTLSKNICIAN